MQAQITELMRQLEYERAQRVTERAAAEEQRVAMEAEMQHLRGLLHHHMAAARPVHSSGTSCAWRSRPWLIVSMHADPGAPT